MSSHGTNTLLYVFLLLDPWRRLQMTLADMNKSFTMLDTEAALITLQYKTFIMLLSAVYSLGFSSNIFKL